MTTSAKPDTPAPAAPATAVATRKAVILPPELQAKVEERRIQSRMSSAIRGATWSKELDANAVATLGAWAYQNDIEPVTEIYVLGGNIYINARHYERKLAELSALGLIAWYDKEWVQLDPRLEKLAELGDEEAKAKVKERLWARITHGIPDNATYACVFSIQYKGLEKPTIGVKDFVPGRRKDPVAEGFPMETIETRACRRAMLKLKAAFPPGFRMATMASDDEDSVEIAQVVQEAHARAKIDRERDAKIGTTPLAQLNPANPLDPYALDTEKPAAEPVRRAGDPWDEDASDEALQRADAKLAEREAQQGALPLGETKRPVRNAIKEGR